MRLLSVFLMVIVGCGGKPPTTTPMSVESLELAHRDAWVGAPAKVCWPKNANCNGNSGLFSGLLCFAGKSEACEHVGGLATSEGLLRYPEADVNAEDSSSRDELLGHLLAIAKTHDKAHAERVLSIVRDGKICDNASDTRCNMTPMMWGLMRVVWNHIGLKPTWQMQTSNFGDDHTLLIQAETAPAGFQQHLIAVILLLRAHTNSWSSTLTDVANSLVKRQPDNELFQWIAGNEEKAAELLRKHAPVEPLHQDKQKQWYVERAAEEEAWKDANSACVWFLARLLSKAP